MKNYLSFLKLFCKTPSIIIPYLILLAADNVILFRLYQSFKENYNAKSGITDALFCLTDVCVTCFLILIFFLFISYEYMRKVRDSQLEELLSVRNTRGGAVYLWQFMVLWTLAVIHALNVLVYCLLGYYAMNMPGFLFHEMIQSVVINIFLLSLAAIGIGYVLSKIKHRFLAYAVIIGMIILIIPDVSSIFLEFQENFHIPVFLVRDFVSLIPPDITAFPDALYGLPLEWYRCAAMLFWVVLSALLCGCRILQHQRKAQFGFCLCMVCVLFFLGYGVVNKGSVLLMAGHPESATLESAKYKTAEQGEKETQELFSVTAYDMEFSMQKELSAKVTVDIQADKTLPEYPFTLFGGYKISRITCDDGRTLAFQQEGNYVNVGNEEMLPVKSMCFYYKGHSAVFYANQKACFLPGIFPYYPKAGHRTLYKKGELINDRKDTEANFRVRITGLHSVVSNLPETQGVFEGKTDNVILISGYCEEKQSDSFSKIYYPLQESSLENIDYIIAGERKEEFNNLCHFTGMDEYKLDFNGKKIISIPDSLSFNSTMQEFYECKDYVLINGQIEPYDILENLLKAEGKEELKEAVFLIKPDENTNPSEISMMKDEPMFDGYDTVSQLYDTLVLKMREYGVEKVTKRVFGYLRDTDNTTDALSFLNGLDEEDLSHVDD